MQGYRSVSACASSRRNADDRHFVSVLSSPESPSNRTASCTPTPIIPKAGTVILDGYGLRIGVERGQLALSDGLGATRRAGRFARASCGIRRLVVLGHTGAITLEALRWLADVGISFTQIDADGLLVCANGTERRDDGRLRRAQAFAPWTGVGMPILRELLAEKLHGQAAALLDVVGATCGVETIGGCRLALDEAPTPEASRAIEAEAAAAYWGAWSTVEMRFGRRDMVPDHWRTFGARRSPLSGASRLAGNPINALLNYLYAILEAEARIAALAMGLDPGLGLLHADQYGRDSLALDLIEPVRPLVDAFILDALARRTFRADDFAETPTGTVRVLPPLTHWLTETAPMWARALAPIVERVAHTLYRAELPAFGTTIDTSSVSQAPAGLQRRTPGKTTRAIGRGSGHETRATTPLTRANRSAARAAVHGRAAAPAVVASLTLPPVCRDCGDPLPGTDRVYCAACWAPRQATNFAEAGIQYLERQRAAGHDPNHGGETARKRGRSILDHRDAAADWEREHGTDYDPADFTRRFLPAIQKASLRRLTAATGLSLHYCSLVRRGERIPHPCHWEAFAQVSAVADVAP